MSMHIIMFICHVSTYVYRSRAHNILVELILVRKVLCYPT